LCRRIERLPPEASFWKEPEKSVDRYRSTPAAFPGREFTARTHPGLTKGTAVL